MKATPFRWPSGSRMASESAAASAAVDAPLGARPGASGDGRDGGCTDAFAPARGGITASAPPAVTLAGAPALLRAAPPAWLYGVVVFAAAWLVFWVQPLSVRGVLPVLGGSPAVWNTAMVFFQAALLGGYALAHLLARRATPAGQLLVLGVLWAGVALTAPVGELRLFGETPPAGLPPALWLLGTLAGALGLAFVAVSAGALVAFPFLLEPFLGLAGQAWLWSAAALGLAPLLFLLWRAAVARDTDVRAATAGDTVALRQGTPRWRRIPAATAGPTAALAHPVRILALSAIPSALLLAVTRYLTTDVAAVPLLWIVPLALYLGTFVHAFARRTLIPQWLLAHLMAPALIALVVLYLVSRTVFVFGVAHLLVFTLTALWCHGALARLRPPAADLTRFYLLVSTGGLAGGMLVALLAPVVFTDVWEYPIALALVAALLPARRVVLRRGHYIAVAVALGVVVAGLAAALGGTDRLVGEDASTFVFIACLALVALAAPALLILRARPAFLAGALLAMFFVPSLVARHAGDEHIARERTFFGVYRIVESEGLRAFYHGTTLHGAELHRADGTIESRTTYYAPETPLGELLSGLTRADPLVLGLAGLGTGSLACYARPGDTVRIYEIDPTVVRLAREHFAALGVCAPDAVIGIGDARLLLAREETPLDVLVLDTFSSDAIPVHLLTEEAFRTYLRVLAPEGILAVHISNRHLDLEPVISGVAGRAGLAGRIKRYEAPEALKESRASTSSNVVVLARDEATLGALDLDAGWAPLGSPDRVRVWTDDYASIVPAAAVVVGRDVARAMVMETRMAMTPACGVARAPAVMPPARQRAPLVSPPGLSCQILRPLVETLGVERKP